MQNEQLLQKINSPADLKMLTLDEMKLLAGEIRHLIIDVVSMRVSSIEFPLRRDRRMWHP